MTEVEPREPLSRGERLALAIVIVISAATLVFALGKSFAASLAFFGEQPSARDNAIAGQALRIALWAFASPLCAALVLRRRRGAPLGAILWLGLLGWTTWWRWPPPPVEAYDADDPLWLSSFPLMWSLVAAGLAVGLHSARRTGRGSVKLATLFLAAGVVGLGAMSHVNLLRQARAEMPDVLAEGPAELSALKRDPIWNAIPSSARTYERESPASRAVWGKRLATTKSMRLGNFDDRRLFRDVVAAAESTGWTLVTTNCSGESWDAQLVKSLSPGNAYLRISVASYIHSVDVVARISDQQPYGRPGKCWGP